MTLEFKLNIRPVPHQSFRVGRNGIKYKPKKIKDYQEYIKKLVLDQLPDDFQIISAGTLIEVVYIHYCYAYPKSMAKKYKVGNVPKVTKPDLHDNLNKALFDALEGIVFEQDQNIYSVKDMQKYYTEIDCIKFKLNY